jgi:hypothetical protein
MAMSRAIVLRTTRLRSVSRRTHSNGRVRRACSRQNPLVGWPTEPSHFALSESRGGQGHLWFRALIDMCSQTERRDPQYPPPVTDFRLANLTLAARLRCCALRPSRGWSAGSIENPRASIDRAGRASMSWATTARRAPSFLWALQVTETAGSRARETDRDTRIQPSTRSASPR